MTLSREQYRYLDLFNITKYTQDPNVYYDGRSDDEKLAKVIGTIKAVKIA